MEFFAGDDMERSYKKRALLERVMEYVFLAAACVSVLCVALICAFLLANGLPAMGEIGVLKFLSGTRWKPGADIYGIFPMIVGSVYVTAGALLLGVPVALLTAVYLAFFCPKGLYRVLKPAVELLAGIVLGVGRAMGETMAVIMVAGNQPRMPKGILQGVRTLTGNIVIEMGYATGLHREALIATGVVLFVFILLINLCFSALKRGKKA